MNSFEYIYSNDYIILKLKPFCGQNIVIAVLSYEFDNSTSRRTESELTASKKSHRCSRLGVVAWLNQREMYHMGIKICKNKFCGHTRALFSKVDGQVNIFGVNGQTGQEHISKDEPIRHL
jgi:hypothetical protein